MVGEQFALSGHPTGIATKHGSDEADPRAGCHVRLFYDGAMLARVDVESSPTREAPLLARVASIRSWVVVVAISALLGVLMSASVAFAALHLATTCALLLWAAFYSKTPDLLIAVTIYAGLCDVLWRASSAPGPYEGAKYAVIFGFAALVIRFVRRPRNRWLCLSLVLVLLPGAVMTTMELGPVMAREVVSANVSGLVAIAVAVLACSNLRLSLPEKRGLFTIAVGPIVSLTALATAATIEASKLTFTDEVNFATSGGFGPNQVSSLLGVGGMLCILLMLQPRVGWRYRLVVLATGVWIMGQAVLTFSRGGVFGLVLASACVGLVALTISGQRTAVIVAAGLLIVVALQVLSWAGTFTGGASEDRLASMESTNRGLIASSELQLFYEHPILGVGPGMAKYDRHIGLKTASHTEYTRLLAEHGVLGVAALVILLLICIRTVTAAQGWDRMAAVGLLAMALTQMAHNATRIGSIAVCFGLAALLGDHEEK